MYKRQVYTLIQWAVPVFLMISGNLLLHSNKITFAKVKRMTIRMGTVLILFGSAFALLEQIFERKTLEIETVSYTHLSSSDWNK